MVLVHVHRFPNKQNHPHAIHPKRNHPFHVQPAQTTSTIHVQSTQTKCVGAVPACPPERPHSGVSIPKIHTLCAGNLTMDAPLQGDTGGHIGAAPTHLHNFFCQQMYTLQHWGRKCIAHSRPFYFKISQIMLSSSLP